MAAISSMCVMCPAMYGHHYYRQWGLCLVRVVLKIYIAMGDMGNRGLWIEIKSSVNPDLRSFKHITEQTPLPSSLAT